MSTKVRFLTSVASDVNDYAPNSTATIDDTYAQTLINVGLAMPESTDLAAALVDALVGDGFNELMVVPSGTSASGGVYQVDDSHVDVVYASGQIAHFEIYARR